MYLLKVKKHELEITYFFIAKEHYEEALAEKSPYRRANLASVIIQKSNHGNAFKVIKSRYDLDEMITLGIDAIISGSWLNLDTVVKRETL